MLASFAGQALATGAAQPACQALDLQAQASTASRTIPLRVRLPASMSPAPVILFSHGLGGSAQGYAYLGEHWCGAGFVTVHLQHPGSDDALWRNKGKLAALRAMRQAANAENLLLRIADVRDTIDQLGRWQQQAGHPLAGRLDLGRIGMAGHSFGALTTQAVSGQRFESMADQPTDPRVRAALMLSPSAPRRGDASFAFSRVSRPWMLMTGTDDVSTIGGATLKDRLAVFAALPPGHHYELVLEGARHLAFSDRELPGERGRRNPAHHPQILALSTAFWRAWLLDDEASREWLAGPQVRESLAQADRWQTK